MESQRIDRVAGKPDVGISRIGEGSGLRKPESSGELSGQAPHPEDHSSNLLQPLGPSIGASNSRKAAPDGPSFPSYHFVENKTLMETNNHLL